MVVGFRQRWSQFHSDHLTAIFPSVLVLVGFCSTDFPIDFEKQFQSRCVTHHLFLVELQNPSPKLLLVKHCLFVKLCNVRRRDFASDDCDILFIALGPEEQGGSNELLRAVRDR